jgi:gliding motility-associated-like protein
MLKQLTKISLTLLMLFTVAVNGLAQNPDIKRATHWYFGNGAGLDFSSGSPVAVTNGALHSREGSATMSDTSGNLLFYTDGDTVWDRNHNVMPNGTGLLGCGSFNNSSIQGALIVPLPNTTNLYYIFTTDCFENNNMGGFNYNIIDLNLNLGNGDVISKNNLLFTPSSEMVAATLHNNGNDIWIVTHELNNNTFRAYLLTNTGINFLPVLSNVGVAYQKDEFSSIEISPNGNLIAIPSPNIQQKTILYSFNNINGEVNYYTSLSTFGGESAVSFSMDNTKIFYTDNGNIIYNYDLCHDDTIDIQSSMNIIDISISNSDYYSLQLAIDDKLYIAGLYSDSLSTIINPNSTAILQKSSLSLNGNLSSQNLPNFADYYFNQQSPCVDTIELSIDTVFQNILIIPNVFTPNNDQINDVFLIDLKGYEKMNWRIYNRWGSELKTGELKIENEETIELWDGRTNVGVRVTDGTYYYIINLTKKGGENETKKGFVQILN